MKNWLILLPLVPSLALSISGPEDAPPLEPTDLKLSWLDSLSMSLELPSTSHLTLLLSPASNLPGEPTPCLFSGTVEQDHDSVVAVTGCKESPETDVTIASSLVPNGLLDLVIVNGSTFTVKEDSSFTEDRTLGAGDDCLEPPADPLSSQHHLAAGSAMPRRVVLKTYVRYDNTLLRKFGGSHSSTRQWLSRVVEMSRPRLVHSSLDTGLQLQLVGEMKHHNEDIQADGPTINRLARNPKERSLVSYFGYQLGGGIIGVAFRGTACRQDGFAVNINELYSSSNSEMKTARVWVHELGHNIGMRHDFDTTHGGQSGPCNNQGLMSYGNSPDKWSACSNTDFAEWFRREGNVCLKPTRTASPTWSGQCVEDNSSRLLQKYLSVTKNSPSTCIKACENAGYQLAGVQYTNQCFCGNTPPPSSVIRADNECNKVCPGNPNQKCGGNWRMNVYTTSAWIGQCVKDNSKRLLQKYVPVTKNSPSTCIKACKDAGYQLAGVQYTNQCFCGNTPPPSSVIRCDNECNKVCPGNPNEKCGGTWRMNVYTTTI